MGIALDYLCDRWLLTESKGRVAAVESDELGLEHDVTVDLKTSALVALNTTKASCVGLINSGEGDLVARDLGHVAVTDGNSHVGKLGVAGVDETANLGIVLRAFNLGVVGIGNVLVDKEERGTGVGNGLGSSRVVNDLAVDAELGRGELPETGACVDRNPRHLALELGGIDLTELVNTGAIGVEVSSEDGKVKVAHDIVEESLLRGFLGAIVDSV